jgi:CRISPR-associated protein Csm4
MNRLKLTLKPVSAFATVPLGDTLFGQLCWQLRYQLGESALNKLLEGYTEGKPFAVVSDFLPEGYVPRPVLPSSKERLKVGADANAEQELVKRRKQLKKLQWVPLDKIHEPVETWVNYAQHIDLGNWFAQYRNSINRLTGTTGKEGFAPYEVNQFWYRTERSDKTANDQKLIVHQLDCYLDYDAQRISSDILQEAMRQIGLSGFGKDASVGAGRFEIVKVIENPAPVPQQHVLTLSNCVPVELNLRADQSFYKLFVRFGRHGAEDVHTGKPFKAPILMAERGALLTLTEPLQSSFVGVGVGGAGLLSNARAETVHQGYAPILGVNSEF